ncbi:MbeB family mobilization protein (plasmid) [Escherichia coli]|nr:MbeB family mobilization protein [Escherichia coli]MDM4847490.1 MbeB family mobilization protein [Escherichia coli]
MKERAESTETMLNDEFRKLEESVNRELTSNETKIKDAIALRIRRSGRAERGVRAHSPAWSERPTLNRDTYSVSYEKAPRFPKGERRTGIR